jgi:hypothetical protein
MANGGWGLVFTGATPEGRGPRWRALAVRVSLALGLGSGPEETSADGNPRPLQETAGGCVLVGRCQLHHVHDLQECYSRREMYVKKVS